MAAGLAMVLAAFFWASMAVGNKAVLVTVLVTEVALIRFVGAGLLLGITQILRGQGRGFLQVGPWPFVMGFLEPGLVTMLTVWGTAHTTAINAAMCWALPPITQPFLARLVLKEPIHGPVVAGAALTVIGTLVLFWGQGQEGGGTLYGDLLLLAGVSCSMVNQLIARKVAVRHGRPLAVTTAQFCSASLVGLVALFLIERPEVPFAGVTPHAAAILAYLIVATAAPFSLYNYALARLSIGHVSLFSPLIGPMGVIMAVLILGEPVSMRDVAAIGIVLLGTSLPTILARTRLFARA
jgi:drug/metabolite transporter (DMT)-like permease